MYQEKLLALIRHNKELAEIFTILGPFHLPALTICAGTIRDLVWNDKLHQHQSLKLGDINVYYNDPGQTYEDFLILLEQLNQQHSRYLWNLNNIALPVRHETQRHFHDSIEKTIADFPEKCTCVGVQKDNTGRYRILAPYGLNDLFELKVQPSPNYEPHKPGFARYQNRLALKHWQDHWPELKIADAK